MRSIAVYARKSKFTGYGESIETQKNICLKKIEFEFSKPYKELPILIFEDEGFSGKDTNRPQFKNMIKKIKNNEICAVYVYKLDRISRSVADFANLITVFNKYNVAFVSSTENYETQTPLGRAMMNISTVFAQLERETTAERIKDNMYLLAKTGRWLGGAAPLGYESVKFLKNGSIDKNGGNGYNGKKEYFFTLKIIKNEALAVENIFCVFKKSQSYTKTAEKLNNMGFKTKNNNFFTRYSVKSVLQNPVYVSADKRIFNYYKKQGLIINGSFNADNGLMIFNKTKQQKGKHHIIKNKNEWIAAVGLHKSIVKSKDFIEVQNIIKEKEKTKHTKK